MLISIKSNIIRNIECKGIIDRIEIDYDRIRIERQRVERDYNKLVDRVRRNKERFEIDEELEYPIE